MFYIDMHTHLQCHSSFLQHDIDPWSSFSVFTSILIGAPRYMSGPDRTKTQNELGNESKNKLKIFTPSGHGKSFHGSGLTSALVIRTSMQVTPPVPRCMAS